MRAVLYCAMSARTSGSLVDRVLGLGLAPLALGSVARCRRVLARRLPSRARTGVPCGLASAACSFRAARRAQALALDAQPPLRRAAPSMRDASPPASPARAPARRSRRSDHARTMRPAIACASAQRRRGAARAAAACGGTARRQRLRPRRARRRSTAAARPAAPRRPLAAGRAAAAPRACRAARARGRRRRRRAARAPAWRARRARRARRPRTRACAAAPSPARCTRRAPARARRGRAARCCRAAASRRPAAAAGQARVAAAVGVVSRRARRARPADRHLLQQRRPSPPACRRPTGRARAAPSTPRPARRRRAPRAPRCSATAWPRSTAPSISRTAGFVEPAGAEGDRLVGERQRVAHRAARRAREQAQRRRLGLDALGAQHRPQVLAAPSRGAIGRRLNCRQRDSTVGGTFCGSVVASTNFRYSGGSSSVFSIALNAVFDEHVHFVDHVDLEAADAPACRRPGRAAARSRRRRGCEAASSST